jgi:hypothetical protein
MSLAVRVDARVPGTPREERLAVDVELPSPSIRVEDLIRRAVEEQVHLLTVQRGLSVLAAQERLDHQYGTHLPDRGIPAINVKDEIGRALAACRAGRCIVVIDGEPVTELAAEITLRPETRVQFLRLVPLQGG